MIEIPYEERERVNKFYEIIKNIIISKKDNKDYYYNFKQHHLYEETDCPGISKKYYNEEGCIIYENINGDKIKLEISRWHSHKHNGCSGLNGIPCLNAKISILNNEYEEQIIWELKVESGTLYYKASVSSDDFPNDILEEKEFDLLNPIIQNQDNNDDINIELQESASIDNKIKELMNNYMSAKKSKEQLLIQQKKELEEAIESINRIYSKKINQSDDEINATRNKLNNFEKLLIKYSTFEIDLLGNTLQALITFMENEEYLFKTSIHRYKKRVHGVMDSWDEDIQARAIIIVKQDKFKNNYDDENKYDSEIDKLVENGSAILLSEENIYNQDKKQISIYYFNDGNKVCNINVGKFSYVKDFLDIVIQYKFQNNMLEITEKDMLFILKDFITNHKDIIIKNYDSKIKERMLVLQLKTKNGGTKNVEK